MLNGPLAKKILLFTLPVALSNMVQQLFNAAALPAVGTMIGTCAFRSRGSIRCSVSTRRSKRCTTPSPCRGS